MNAEVKEPDLRDVDAWRDSVDIDGRPMPDVIMSWCGRYTVVRYPPAGAQPESFTAVRRHGPPAEARWSPPTWSEAVPNLLAGIARCAEHLRQELEQ